MAAGHRRTTFETVPRVRTISAKFAQRCRNCSEPIEVDSTIIYDDETKRAYHPHCAPPDQAELYGQSAALELAESLGFRPHEELCPGGVLRDMHATD